MFCIFAKGFSVKVVHMLQIYNVAFNTMYNALYAAGGITENATLREVKLFRNNKLERRRTILLS